MCNKNEIQKTLLDIGIPTNLLGFNYITAALQLSLQDSAMSIKAIYVEVAKEFSTSNLNVERCIRHAINVGWSYGITPAIMAIFRQSINPQKGVPSNTQFLTGVTMYLSEYT